MMDVWSAFLLLTAWLELKVRKKSYNLLTTGFLLTWSFHWARSFRCYLTQMRLNRPFFCLFVFFKMRFVYLKQRFTPRGVKYRIPEASTDHFQRLNLFKRSSLAKLFEMTFGWLVSAAPRQLPPLIKCDGQVEAGLKVWQPQPWGGARTVSYKKTLWNLLCSPQDFSVGEHLTVLQKDLSQEQIWEGCRSRNVGSWFRVLPDTWNLQSLKPDSSVHGHFPLEIWRIFAFGHGESLRFSRKR